MFRDSKWMDNKFLMFMWCILLLILGVITILRPIRVTILVVTLCVIVALLLKTIIGSLC
jgi:hypothetical protein